MGTTLFEENESLNWMSFMTGSNDFLALSFPWYCWGIGRVMGWHLWAKAWLFHTQRLLLVNGRHLSRARDSSQGLCKQARLVLPESQRCQGTAFSSPFSSLLSSEEKSLFLDHVFWGCHISSWDFSALETCLIEVEPYNCLKCFALKSESKFGYARNEVIFKVNKLLTCKIFITLAF